ncbi:MAG: VanZ family protein [Sedimentisphaerales bacterium]
MWIGAFTATHVPYSTIPRVFRDLGHFTLHVLGFLGLSSWFILTLAAFNFSSLRRIVVVLLIMTIYGAIDEYTQQFFGRSTSFSEWLIDTGATIVALVIWESVFWLTKKCLQPQSSNRG